MKAYFEQMSESYINQHYPKRSVFAAIDTNNKKGGIGIYIFFGVILLLFGALAILGIAMTFLFIKDGENDQISTGLIITGFSLVFCALSVWVILLTKKRRRMGSEGWLKKCAETSSYSESEIREFDRQAMSFDSYILNLAGRGTAALSGQKPGILTRDYIYLADSKNIVMKRNDIVSACLVERIFYMNVNNRSKPVPYLSITLNSNNGIQSIAETTKEAGGALLLLLQEQNPQIHTNDNMVMTEKDYDNYRRNLNSEPS